MASKWAGLAALLAGFFVILLDATIVSVASPSIAKDLKPSVAGLFWVTAGYLLAFSVPLLVAGRLGDRYDPKRVFLVGMGGFAAASVLCGLAPTVGWLIFFRIVQGLAAATMGPQPMTLIRRLFAAEERGRAMGLWGTVSSAGALIGPILGGVLIAVLNWRWIFWVNVPVCVVAMVLGLRWIPSSRRQATALDLFGALASTVGLGVLVWALLAWPYSSALVLSAAAVVGAALLVFFAFHERRMGPAALVVPELYRSAGYLAASGASAALGTAVTAMALPAMLYLQETRGLGPMESALVMTPDAVLATTLAPVAGRWIDRVGPRRPAILGMALLVASLFLMGLVVVLNVDPLWAALAAVVLGVANATAWSPLSVAAMAAVAPETAGAASGMFSTVRQVSTVAGVAVVGAVLAGLRSSPKVAFSSSFALLTLIAVAGVFATTRLPLTSSRITSQPAGPDGE